MNNKRKTIKDKSDRCTKHISACSVDDHANTFEKQYKYKLN